MDTMDPPDTVLNFSEIKSPIKGAETNSKQSPPTSSPQQTPAIPIKNDSHVLSFNRADINYGNPRARLATDALGQELHPQASIWQMYVEEAIEQDTELVEVQNKNLDLMLLFAALFSAILTAFLIESTSMLQQNPVDASATLLLFIAQSQRRIELGIPANTLDPIASNEFSPSMLSRFINGLWFTSLALSLSAALIAMLAKEWLASYLATSEHYALATLEDINLVFSDKWESLSADEHALLSTAQLALTDVLASTTHSHSQSSSSHGPVIPQSTEHTIEIGPKIAESIPTARLKTDSESPLPEPLKSSCGRALARTSIQLRYHLNNQARIN
ncbi:unnamed protein product [Rhizoctonia solani]|uniref:DUF6535 domain-containing protein n=1 Tax=Rhizoctonia solani TaxID=456999 RepID=A0A8H3GYL5_9AGAM|nr:unnamed protein product [Rhizoctonia solani]